MSDVVGVSIILSKPFDKLCFNWLYNFSLCGVMIALSN